MDIESKINELIRDVTKVGSVPKSEVRWRILDIHELGKESERERILKIIDELHIVISKDGDKRIGDVFNNIVEESKKTLKKAITQTPN